MTNLRAAVRRKFKTNEQKQVWWAKFAAVRRRRVWRLSEQQNHRCCYCYCRLWVFDGEQSIDHKFYPDRLPGMTKNQMATADHYIPVSKGGSESITNIVVSCVRCNRLRGDMPALEFWECAQDPKKLKALLSRRNRAKGERDVTRRKKRRDKYQQTILWHAYLRLVSPSARSVFDEVIMFLEQELTAALAA